MSTRGQSDVHKYLVLACIIPHPPPGGFLLIDHRSFKGTIKEILENSRGFLLIDHSSFKGTIKGNFGEFGEGFSSSITAVLKGQSKEISEKFAKVYQQSCTVQLY
jgi:hypothetical protein